MGHWELTVFFLNIYLNDMLVPYSCIFVFLPTIVQLVQRFLSGKML